MPGGITLCSPGTFLVANYLIINNGSCQVNFTKPNSATIRYTNSQWPRRDGSEMPVGRVAVPKTGKSIGTLPFLDRSAGRSSRGDCSEVPVGKVAVPKTSQKPPSPRGDATEMLVGRVPVPKTGQKPLFVTP